MGPGAMLLWLQGGNGDPEEVPVAIEQVPLSDQVLAWVGMSALRGVARLYISFNERELHCTSLKELRIGRRMVSVCVYNDDAPPPPSPPPPPLPPPPAR